MIDKLKINRLVIILVVIITLLLWIIITFIPRTSECKDLKIFKKILLSNVVNKVKEGDLILFSSNRYNILTRTFGNDTFSHIGIVVKINDKFYIYEMVEKDYMSPKTDYVNGISFSLIEDRIKNYNGNVYISSLINNLSEYQIEKLNNFTKRSFNFTKRWKMPFILYTSIMLKNERFCSELIAELLNILNISNIPFKSKKSKLQTNIINLCNDIIYYKPIHIIPDNLLINQIRNKNNYIDFC
jgi:hypothetical protein